VEVVTNLMLWFLVSFTIGVLLTAGFLMIVL